MSEYRTAPSYASTPRIMTTATGAGVVPMPETRQLRELKDALRQTAEAWEASTASRERKKGAEVALETVRATIERLAAAEPDRPSEATYSDHHDTVTSHAEAVIENLTEYPDEFDTVDDAVNQVVENAHAVTYPGWALVTVLHSQQDPDDPEYSEPWTAYLDLEARPTWGRVLMEMARACLYSDVYGEVARCPVCGGLGHNWEGEPPAMEKVECEPCDGSGRRDLDALAGRAADA